MAEHKAHRTHRKNAMQDPGDVYAAPEDVLNDDKLSQDEKRKILKNWADEIQHILESDAENMQPDEGSSCEEELLRNITKVLDSLNREA